MPTKTRGLSLPRRNIRPGLIQAFDESSKEDPGDQLNTGSGDVDYERGGECCGRGCESSIGIRPAMSATTT